MSRRLTGFSPLTRKQIQDRSAATDTSPAACEVWQECGPGTSATPYARAEQIHHRRPRGQGGTRRTDTNQAANGLAVCARCHLWIENNRSDSLRFGWLVSQHRTPADIPVLRRGIWVLLADSGDIQQIPEPAGGRVA